MTSSQQRRAAPESTTSKTRGRLLDATIELLQVGGPESATSRAIASASGENLGAITYYFGSKNDLVSEAMAVTARQLIGPVVDELTDDTKDGVSKLLSAVQKLYSILQNNEHLLRTYLHALAAAPTNQVVAAEIVSLHQELATTLAVEMASQKERNLLPEWVQPEPMGQLIVALVNGVAVTTTIDPANADPVAIGAQFTQLLLNARAPGQ